MLLKDDYRKEERRDELDLKQDKTDKGNNANITQQYTLSFSKYVTVMLQFFKHHVE